MACFTLHKVRISGIAAAVPKNITDNLEYVLLIGNPNPTDGEVPMKKLDPMYRLVFENRGYLDAKANIGAMMEEIARIAPDDAPALQRYMDENRQKLAHFKPVLESAFESLKDFVKPEVMKSIFMLRPAVH